MKTTNLTHPTEIVARQILLIRGQKVMLDVDLAELYDVPTKRLNEQVKRNTERFPLDFMFQLSQEEKAEVVAKCDHLVKIKFSSTLPYAFTEHGALMLGNVLKSARAVEVSLEKYSGLRWDSSPLPPGEGPGERGIFHAGYSPERINPGDKQHRLPTIKKVTSGSTPEIADFVDGLYRSIITAGTHKASSIILAISGCVARSSMAASDLRPAMAVL